MDSPLMSENLHISQSNRFCKLKMSMLTFVNKTNLNKMMCVNFSGSR